MLYQRILITGANGLLGQELVSYLEQFPEYPKARRAIVPAKAWPSRRFCES